MSTRPIRGRDPAPAAPPALNDMTSSSPRRQSQPITGIILAGGASSRMGMDKALLHLDGTTFLGRIVETLDRVVDEVIVVGRERLPRDAARARVVTDELPGRGPLGGLLTGMHAARHADVL